ncbi:MAG: glycosyltransferase [bacterium]|nr:glycosyltransferase [bacterium]
MNNKSILIFTNRTPFSEKKSFIEDEIRILSKEYDKIFIFPYSKGEVKYHLPENIKIVNLFLNNIYNRNNTLKKNGLTIINILLKELFTRNLSFKNYKYIISWLLRFIDLSYTVEKWIKDNNLTDVLCYSYWFTDWAIILAILKKNKIIKNFVSRAHSYDLYERKEGPMYIMFRHFQLKQIDRLFLISNNGLNYIKNKYPKHKNKYKLSYLGTMKHKKPPPENKESKPIIVSCSSMNNKVKRIHLIIEALHEINIPLKWVHFGSGTYFEEIKSLSKNLPSNIDVELKGYQQNSKIMTFYENTYISAFLNVSESEGLPVSIIEAISFGIPIIATNVRGTPEIVNNKTGILIPKNFKVKELRNTIENIIINNNNWARTKIRKFWHMNFNAEINYKKYFNELSSIC